ncbi:MAG: family 16 glycosylhydrolase, partial [Kiritimatiellaeota bacterium]|nr:family 16 glycosylhydrolase [Kiritimatiellota bacterium]
IADFHIYALEWEPGEIRWFVDGRLYSTQTFWWSSSELEGNQGSPLPRATATSTLGLPPSINLSTSS